LRRNEATLPTTYRIEHRTRYEYTSPVSYSQNQLRLTPRSDASQKLLEHAILSDPKPQHWFHRHDWFGNEVSYFELLQPHNSLEILHQALVQIDRFPVPIDAIENSPPWETAAFRSGSHSIAGDQVNRDLTPWQFAFASRHVPLIDELREISREVFTPGRPILSAIVALQELIHQSFEYRPQSTAIDTPLIEVLQQRRGVCQDFAHVAIGCARMAGLAARYVSGYLKTYPPKEPRALIGADASHAWLSIYAGQLGWIDLDPTNRTLVGDEHVTLAWGRDFRDVTPINGLYLGGKLKQMQVAVKVDPIDLPSNQGQEGPAQAAPSRYADENPATGNPPGFL
jgi:transglutaminase-like putative cysteine protease